MKSIIMKTLAIALALALVPAALAAEVVVRREGYVYRSPSYSGEAIEWVESGDVLEYWDETRVDANGVEWYNVIYGNLDAWISSEYAVLEDDGDYDGDAWYDGDEYGYEGWDEGEDDWDEGEFAPSNDGASIYDASGRIDLESGIGMKVEALPVYDNLVPEEDGFWASDALSISTEGGVVNEIDLGGGEDYMCIAGVYSGMTVQQAEAALFERGWTFTEVYTEDTDLHQRFYVDAQGREIDLYTYDFSNYNEVGLIILRATPHDW